MLCMGGLEGDNCCCLFNLQAVFTLLLPVQLASCVSHCCCLLTCKLCSHCCCLSNLQAVFTWLLPVQLASSVHLFAQITAGSSSSQLRTAVQGLRPTGKVIVNPFLVCIVKWCHLWSDQAMEVDYLTRENVASHLQKYRLQLKREQEHKGRTSTSRATPSCSATAPAVKSASGPGRTRSAGPKEPAGVGLAKAPAPAAKRAPAHEGNDARATPNAARPAPAEREQPVELQDTAASFRHAPVKMAPSSRKAGSASSGDSPGSNTPMGEDKSGSGELGSGSRSPHSGSSRTMMQRKATE
jgi:hypothetical protein